MPKARRRKRLGRTKPARTATQLRSTRADRDEAVEATRTTAKRPRRTYPTDIILATLEKSGCNVRKTARVLGCDVETIYRRVSPERLNQMRAEFVECLIDEAEDQLFARVKAGYWPAIRFVLLTKGKDRGWQFGRKDVVQSVTISATLTEILSELEKRKDWDEVARTTCANRHAGLLGDGGVTAREVGHGAVVTGAASPVDRSGDDGELAGATTVAVAESAHHRSAAAPRKK